MNLQLAGMWRRLATPGGAVAIGAVVLALGVAGVPLAGLAHQLNWSNIEWLAVVLPFGAVGFLVAWRQPRNALGWLLLITALLMLVQTDADYYVLWDYGFRHGHLPWGAAAIYLSISPPIQVLLALAILLFPDGRLPSARWKWLLVPVAVIAALDVLAGIGQITRMLLDHLRIDVIISSGDVIVPPPPGHDWIRWFGQAQKADIVLFAVLIVAWLFHHVPRYRRSRGDFRLQMKWLIAGAVTTVICGVLLTNLSNTVSNSSPWWVFAILGLSELGLAALPMCVGVAVLRYRLYEIDRLVSRTLSYAIVTGLLVGVYAGVVTFGTRVLPFSSPVGVAASTLVVAALFNPLRHRVQRAVDRRFNRPRYDAEATVAAFASRLRDEVDLTAVSDQLVEAVSVSVQPAHVSVWIRQVELG